MVALFSVDRLNIQNNTPLAILVLKLSSMGKICPVRVLFHKLPLNVSNNSFLAAAYDVRKVPYDTCA